MFVPHAAKILQPHNDLLKGVKSGKNAVIWNDLAENAFNESKNALANATLLAHPVPDAKLSIVVDASDFAMGAVFQQFVDNAWQPLSFYTKTLTPAQKKYSAYDFEMLGMFTGVKRFKNQVEGRTFIIYTDHKLLIYAFQQNLEKCSPRQFRHLDYISQFTTDIRHIKVLENCVADALSRIETVSESVSYISLENEQKIVFCHHQTLKG